MAKDQQPPQRVFGLKIVKDSTSSIELQAPSMAHLLLLCERAEQMMNPTPLSERRFRLCLKCMGTGVGCSKCEGKGIVHEGMTEGGD